MPPLHRPRGMRSRREANRSYDDRRGSARDRGYDAKWDKASALNLAEHPFCAYCEAGAFGEPCITAASCTDHLYPHKRDRVLFWNPLYWVSACATCHDGPKQAAERSGLPALHALADLLGLPRLGG